MDYTIQKVNGIDCIFAPMNDTHSITIEVMVKAGNIYETRENNGISHFLEHMFFKGGKKYPTPMSVAQAVENFGGEFNAYTGGIYAGYYVKCAPEFAPKALDVLSDMLVDSQFLEPEMEREKWVVIQEIKMYNDNPRSVAYDKWKQRYIGDSSYGWSVLGPEENVKKFTQKDLFDHKNALYTKDNLLIVVAGKISDKEGIIALIENLFARLPDKKTWQQPAYTRTLPQEKVHSYKKETQQNHLIFSAPGFSGKSKQRFAASLFSTILGGNMSSRLFQNIREKQGLCYYIGASHRPQQFDGNFSIGAWIDKERFDSGVEQINKELDQIATGDISQEEFDNAKWYRIGSLQMGIETSDSLASFLGNQYLIYWNIETLDDIIATYKNLTLQEVQQVAHHLHQDNRYLFYVE